MLAALAWLFWSGLGNIQHSVFNSREVEEHRKSILADIDSVTLINLNSAHMSTDSD